MSDRLRGFGYRCCGGRNGCLAISCIFIGSAGIAQRILSIVGNFLQRIAEFVNCGSNLIKVVTLLVGNMSDIV